MPKVAEDAITPALVNAYLEKYLVSYTTLAGVVVVFRESSFLFTEAHCVERLITCSVWILVQVVLREVFEENKHCHPTCKERELELE